jgi:hypothetical protein
LLRSRLNFTNVCAMARQNTRRALGIVAALVAGCSPASPSPRVAPPATAPPPAAPAIESVEAGAPLTADERHIALAALNATVDRLPDPRWTELIDLAIAETTKLRDKAPKADRALLERGLQLQRDFRAASPIGFRGADGKLLTRLIELDRAWAARYPDDAWSQLWLAKTLRNGVAAMMSFDGTTEAEADAREAEGNAIVKVLAEKFPDDAFVQSERGDVCVAENEDRLDCMRRFARCVALAPTMKSCTEELGRLRDEYTAPSCAGAQINPALSVRLATSEPQSPSKETIAVDGKKLTLEPAFVTAGDIEEIRSIAFEDAEGRAKTVIVVRVAASKRAEVKAVHRAADKARDAQVVFFDGARKIGSGSKYGIIDDGSRLDWTKDPKLDRACKAISRRALPSDLSR